MATITQFRWHEMDVEDKRDVRENLVRNKITLKTSERVNWTTLRRMPPVPQWNQPHPTEPGFFLDFVKPNHKSRLVWELEADYTPFAGGQVDPDPLNRPPVITYSTSLIEQPTFYTPDNKPIVNRAGEFITGVMEQIPLVEYQFSKNLPADPAWLQTHLGAVNSDTITLRGLKWAPKTLLLATVSGGEFTTENRSTYTPTSGTILADYRTWTQEVWNRGTVQLKQVKRLIRGVPKLIWIQDPIKAGNPKEPVSEPVPLDERGFQIVEPFPGGIATETDQKFIRLKFDTQRSLPFAALPLK